MFDAKSVTLDISRRIALRRWLAVAFGTALAALHAGSASAAECTWTGNGPNPYWSTPANWTCQVGTVPQAGDVIWFVRRTGMGSQRQQSRAQYGVCGAALQFAPHHRGQQQRDRRHGVRRIQQSRHCDDRHTSNLYGPHRGVHLRVAGERHGSTRICNQLEPRSEKGGPWHAAPERAIAEFPGWPRQRPRWPPRAGCAGRRPALGAVGPDRRNRHWRPAVRLGPTRRPEPDCRSGYREEHRQPAAIGFLRCHRSAHDAWQCRDPHRRGSSDPRRRRHRAW